MDDIYKNKQFIYLNYIPKNNDSGCDWYIYLDSTADGFPIWVSTKNPSSPIIKEDLYYYNPFDLDFFNKIVNQNHINKIGCNFDEELLEVEEIVKLFGIEGFDDEDDEDE